jgi:hypothetical protein
LSHLVESVEVRPRSHWTLPRRMAAIARFLAIAILTSTAWSCGGGENGPGLKSFVAIQTPADGATLACAPESANLCQCEVDVTGGILDAVDFSRQSIHVLSATVAGSAGLWYVQALPADVTAHTWSQTFDHIGGQQTICSGDTFVLFAAAIDQGNTPYIGMNPIPLSSLPLQVFHFVGVTVVRPDGQDCPPACSR